MPGQQASDQAGLADLPRAGNTHHGPLPDGPQEDGFQGAGNPHADKVGSARARFGIRRCWDVSRLAAAPFQEQVEQADAAQALPGLTFAVTGPWPPYSFCPALSLE